jgi:hypothetical protein
MHSELKLNILKDDIEQNAKLNNTEAWFYPEYSGVKGFMGAKDIFLIGLNPSSGIFPSRRDKRLYNLLKEKNLHDIHITDFIKIRAKNNDVSQLLEDARLIKGQISFFKREVDILKPKLLITMGYKCDELVKKNIELSYLSIKRIKHYSYRFQNEDLVFNELSESLDEIIEKYLKL